MVATQGQAVSDGPVTSTPSSAAPVRHTVTQVAPASEAGPTRRCGDRAMRVDLAGSAARGTQTTETGTNNRPTQMGPVHWSKLPWLATDDKSGTEPEDVYCQGDRHDPQKAGLEPAVGGAVGGTRYLALAHAA